MPPVLEAKTIHIVCPQGETAEKHAFAMAIAKGMTERINTRGFRTPSEDTSVQDNDSSLPHASLCREEEAGTQEPKADLTLRLKVNDYALKGVFSAEQVDISRRFSATVLVYGKDSTVPYTATSKFEMTATAVPPKSLEVRAVPSWSDGGYSDDEDIRLEKYAGECAEAVITALVTLSAKDTR